MIEVTGLLNGRGGAVVGRCGGGSGRERGSEVGMHGCFEKRTACNTQPKPRSNFETSFRYITPHRHTPKAPNSKTSSQKPTQLNSQNKLLVTSFTRLPPSLCSVTFYDDSLHPIPSSVCLHPRGGVRSFLYIYIEPTCGLKSRSFVHIQSARLLLWRMARGRELPCALRESYLHPHATCNASVVGYDVILKRHIQCNRNSIT